MSHKKRVRNYTDSHVQGALVRRVLFHWCIFFAVTAIALTAVPALTGDPAIPFSERFSAELGKLVTLSVLMLALLPAFMLDTVRFSNRFVGPIARMRSSLRKLSQTKQADKIQFRGNDFWSEMADEFNNIVDLVESQKSEAESSTEEVVS